MHGLAARALAVGAGLLAIGWLGGCRTVDVTTDWDPAVDFRALDTWDFAEPPRKGGADRPHDYESLLSQRVKRGIEAELAAKGFRRVEDGDPDFRVAWFRVGEDQVAVTTINNYWGYGPGWGWRYGYSPGWGYGPGGFGTHTYVDQYQEGTLVIDVSRGPDNELVWRGTGSSRIEEPATPARDEEKIRKAVAEILAKFPPPA